MKGLYKGFNILNFVGLGIIILVIQLLVLVKFLVQIEFF
jgi:hypothetical protein